MPVAAAAIIFIMLMLTGSLSGLAAIGGLSGMLLAAAFWPLDWTGGDVPGVEVPAVAGRRIGDGQRSGWRAVVDAIPTAALALDANGDLLHHNRLAAEMFPKIRDGAPMSKISRSPDLLAAIDRLLAGTEERIDVELVDRVPVERRLEATVSRLAPIDRASPPHVLVTFHDMTEEDRLGQMRSDFIANASHELRTPLASLRGFVETLQGPARDDANARERFLKLMADQAERMTRLIDDLLSLSRVEMRAHLPPRGIAELNETASYVCQSLEPIAEAQRAKVVLVSDVETARVRGDREEIVQVLQNLIQNAIKYGRSGGTIEVRIGRTAPPDSAGARVWVSVTDEGHGIAAEHLPRLTERFYRVSAISSREKGGTGLGLAIVKHILNRHRAELRISSKIGVGSTFTASFEELGAAG
ncbi:ATP-binding protein [Hyphomicrobium sp. D-2]|uniref:ATP-binding protein n=1 Tax=Hyphomicrobium sp. D-2 TaxID=3041621 RepID=UPI0024583228|nr:ATP-binding protein [Hyphomicrobium sp. D-2]MDH4983181.1 ATP-binding protein [Hyphomicrobium sp. D-2]